MPHIMDMRWLVPLQQEVSAAAAATAGAAGAAGIASSTASSAAALDMCQWKGCGGECFTYVTCDAWRWMVAVGALLPILMFLLACFVMPETPRWLISKGKKEQALKVLRRLNRTEQEAVETAESIAQAVAEERAVSGQLGSPLRQLCRPTPRLRLMLIVVVGVAVMQQVRKLVLITSKTNEGLRRNGNESNE